MKYKTGAHGKIIEISKLVQDGEGEAVGINKISRAGLPVLVEALRRCEDSDYFERGIELSISEGLEFNALDISEYRCIEVDFEEDLIRARQLFSEEGMSSELREELGKNPLHEQFGL